MTERSLTAQDVRALKHADALCFDHRDGEGQIRAILRAENSDTGFEQTHTIPAALSRIESYGGPEGELRAFAMLQSSKYSDIAQTLIRHLRTGSQFAFKWTRDNSSPITRDAGLVRDELRVSVQGKNAKVADTFLIEVFIGKDNTARMVQLA